MKYILLAVLWISCMSTKASSFKLGPQHGLKPDFIVDANGGGDFKTVQEAINAVPDFRKKTTVIFIRNGRYKEKLVLAGSKQMVKLIGESRDGTILSYDDYAQKKNTFGEEKGTSGSSSFYIYGNDFNAENLTFENSSGPVGQAVAVWAAGDRLIFNNCRFLGFQDTLYTFGTGSRQYYQDCYIEGTVDFIFGAATAWFERCTLYAKKPGGYLTAASTPDTTAYGYVFNNCKVSGDAPDRSFYLGRPWRPYAKVAFLNCSLPALIHPLGWDNWGKESNKKTSIYVEYNSSGKGKATTGRVKWAHLADAEEAAYYSIDKVLRGWVPDSKQPSAR